MVETVRPRDPSGLTTRAATGQTQEATRLNTRHPVVLITAMTGEGATAGVALGLGVKGLQREKEEVTVGQAALLEGETGCSSMGTSYGKVIFRCIVWKRPEW